MSRSKNSNLLMVEPSATVKIDKWCTYYSSYVMHAFSKLLSHGGYIYYINLYGTDDVSMCGVVMGIRIEWCFR